MMFDDSESDADDELHAENFKVPDQKLSEDQLFLRDQRRHFLNSD